MGKKRLFILLISDSSAQKSPLGFTNLPAAKAASVPFPRNHRYVCVVVTDADDMKFDPFGTSGLSTLVNYDWSEREECLTGELGRPQSSEGASLPPSAAVQRKEPSFGSAENITNGDSPKMAASLPEEGGPPADDKFEAFADFGSKDGLDTEDDFGDFASTFSEKSDSPAAPADAGSEGIQSEASDEFGAFQGDKPKFGKSDFLKASAQANVKSSEEMIKNELATFDLSVQGENSPPSSANVHFERPILPAMWPSDIRWQC